MNRTFETLNVTVTDAVCTVTLSRPEKLNAMSKTMREELGDCFLAIARDRGIRAVILTGAGRAFSAGGDINDFRATPEEMHQLMADKSHRWFKALWALPQPVIAAVNGVAAGGGCNLALACDLVFASTEAVFVQTFLAIGLVPDLGGAFVLPRLIGLNRAKEFALLGERVDAARALDMGLVNRVCPPDRLMAEANAAAARLAAGSPAAITLTKRMMNRSFEACMEAVLDSEWMAQSFLFGTADSQRGVAAFLSKGDRRQDPPKA